MAVHGLLWATWVLVTQTVLPVASSISCMNEHAQPVDWFVVYKMPKQPDQPFPVSEGLGYYYMDASRAEWTRGVSSLNTSSNAVAYTLRAVYEKSQNRMFAMYNDEHPDGYKRSDLGHTKGVLASDKDSGFWLVHSVPKFPTTEAYSYPSSGTIYGQTFLCISLAYKYMDVVGKLYWYNYPSFYSFSLPGDFASDNPYLDKATRKEHVETAPYSFTTPLVSLGGEKFQAFAKYAKFQADLYKDFVAPVMKTSLYVETWQNGPTSDLNSSCTVPYKVYNVKAVEVMNTAFSESHDHAKWAVSTSKPITCIGDINRQVSQESRGGGTVCFGVASVHTNFKNAITKYEKCL